MVSSANASALQILGVAHRETQEGNHDLLDVVKDSLENERKATRIFLQSKATRQDKQEDKKRQKSTILTDKTNPLKPTPA